VIIDNIIAAGLHNNTVTIIMCEKCEEIHATRIEVVGFYDDEDDIQYGTQYEDACPICGHRREYGVAMNPPQINL